MKHATGMLLYVFLCLLTSACTSSTVLETQNALRDPGAARLHFIRPSTFVGAFQSIGITINGTKIGSLGVGTHLYIDREPGQYNVVIAHELDFGKWEQTIEAPSRQEYYFKIVPGPISVTSVGTTTVVNGRMGVIPISEGEGTSLIEAIKN
ncbi:MAG: DUF2846 domain-containing protein [Rhodomicrobiaceae bacterium]